MPEQTRSYKYLALALATVLLTLLMSVAIKQGQDINSTEGWLKDAVVLAQKPATALFAQLNRAREFLSEVRRLSAENELLKAELSRVAAQENVMINLWNENKRLRHLLDLPPEVAEFELLAARVVARDPGNWYETVVIDQGTRAGIRIGSVIITERGVVGRVNRVSARSSEVLLISDQRSAVGAMGQISRDIGVLNGGDADGTCRMIYLPRTATIEVGEIIVTSGLGGVYPKGLVLGQVLDVSAEDYGLGQFAHVQPAVDLYHLEEVLVIVDDKG